MPSVRFAPALPWCPRSRSPIRGEKLQVHIGIATGTVVIGELIGSGDARHQTAIGETPNLAARLQEIAEPDCVVIDDATRRQIGGLFTCRDLGAAGTEGVSPAGAGVAGDGGARRRRPLRGAACAARLVPLVDRDEELALLMCRWRQATAGKGQLVLLAGEPGIGKSRLIVELRARLRSEPHASLRYFCSPHHQASPLYPDHRAAGTRGGLRPPRWAGGQAAQAGSRAAAGGRVAEDVALIADLLGGAGRMSSIRR